MRVPFFTLILAVFLALTSAAATAGGSGGAGGNGSTGGGGGGSGSSQGGGGSSAGSGGPVTPAGSNGAISVPAGAIIHTRRPTVYIIAASFDSPTATAVTMEAAIRLNAALSTLHFTYLDKNFPGYVEEVCKNPGSVCLLPPSDKPSSTPPSHKVWLLPEPAWQLSDFISQCQSDPQDTVGAIIIGAVENDSGNFNYLIWSAGYTNLFADAAFLTCEARGAAEYVAAMPTSSSPPIAQSLPAPTSPSSSQQVDTVQTQLTVTHPATTPAASLQIQNVVTYSPLPNATPQTARSVTRTNVSSTGAFPNTTVSTRTSTSAKTWTHAPVPHPTPTPAMNIIWDAGSSLVGKANQGGVPLYALVGAGTYLASRTKTTTQTTPGNCSGAQPSPVPKGLSCATETTSPTIPIGFALFGSFLAGLQSTTVTVGGANPSRVLKNAAAALAQGLAHRLYDDCTASPDQSNGDMVWLCSEIFDSSKLHP